MPAISGRRALHLVIAVVIAVLVTGCAGGRPTPGHSTASSTPTPTPTPMTAAELAWIQAITTLHQQIDKPFMANLNMTRAKMNELGDALASCKRELSRIGLPGERLQPAYALVKQACRTYSKGARCFARAARVSDAAGAVIVGTPEEGIQRRALACGFAAYGNGSNILGEAETKAAEIRARFP